MKRTHLALIWQHAWIRGLLVVLLAILILASLPLRNNAQASSSHNIVAAMARPMQSGTTLHEYPIPTANSGSSNLTVGLDDSFWFTETNSNKIGQVTIDGVFNEFPLPTANSQPFGITSGPDTRLWFTEQGTNKIGTITLDGAITEFSVPTASSKPTGIAAGSDGALWFTENTANKIGRITTNGTVTEFAIPTANSAPLFIAQGPDGNMWFTENAASKIGRITPAGAVSEFATPTANSGPHGITAAFDGNIWFTEKSVDKIGVATTAGSITEIPLFAGSDPARIVAATDGSVLVTEQAPAKILKVTPSAANSEITPSDYHIETAFNETLLSPGSGPTGITFIQNSPSGFTAGVETQVNQVVTIENPNLVNEIEFTKVGPDAPVLTPDAVHYQIRVKNNTHQPLKSCQVFDQANSKLLFSPDFGFPEAFSTGTSSIKFDLQPGEEKIFRITPLGIGSGLAKNRAVLYENGNIVAKKEVTTTFVEDNQESFELGVRLVAISVPAGEMASLPIDVKQPRSPAPQAREVKAQDTSVNLSASVFPATDTITTNFSPNPATVPGSTTLNINTASSTPAGSYNILITGTAGSVTHNAIATLTVTVGPDFTLGFDQPTATVPAGTGKVPVTVKINRTGGFTGAVTVTPPPKTNGIKAKPPEPITTTGSSVTFKFKAGGAAPGQYPLTFTVQDGAGKTRTGTLTLIIQ